MKVIQISPPESSIVKETKITTNAEIETRFRSSASIQDLLEEFINPVSIECKVVTETEITRKLTLEIRPEAVDLIENLFGEIINIE